MDNSIPKVKLPDTLRSYTDHVSCDCALYITRMSDEDLSYQVHFLIQGVSIKYADEIFRYIQDKLTENKSLDPALAF